MMTAFNMIHDAISDRINNPNARNYPDPWWEKEISALTNDLEITFRFIRQECTDDELFWMGEIFDDLIQITKSKELLECLRERAETVQDSQKKAEVIRDIEEAASLMAD